MPPKRSSVREIVVIGFDGVQTLDVVGPMEVFAVANRHRPPSVPPYRITLASQTGGEIATHAGLQLAGAVALDAVAQRVDTILVGGGSERALREAASEAGVLPWLRSRARGTRRIASICTGAFVLAAAGFLDGRRATTHWNACDLLARLRPAVRVEPDAIFVDEHPFYTSAGATAGIDLSLAMVEADCGYATALAVARELVLFMRRPGGQSQFSAGLRVQADATPRVAKLLTSIIDNPTGDLSATALAARLGVSERTLSRLFRKTVDATPAAFVESARVERAKGLLETSDWPLARVAERAGFGSLDGLHRAFQRNAGVTPGEYRARFGARRHRD
jgi:transcriptional regulator GlxA family with amidase domain